MISFDAFASEAPELAMSIREKLTATGIGLLGTVRKDGSPRISPIEVSFQRGGVYVGMMPGSLKARDLQRDPRFVLLTPVADKDDLGGEGKLFGAAREVTDPAEVTEILGTALEGTEVEIEDFAGSHAFELLVDTAAWQHVELEAEAWCTASWREGRPVRNRQRIGPAGLPEDVPG